MSLGRMSDQPILEEPDPELYHCPDGPPGSNHTLRDRRAGAGLPVLRSHPGRTGRGADPAVDAAGLAPDVTRPPGPSASPGRGPWSRARVEDVSP